MKYATILCFILAVCGANAQQLPQLTQYQFNDYVINPAVAGSRPFFEFRSAHRYQWIGINDAPRTFFFSASTPVSSNMGVGGYLFTDVVGPSRRAGFQLSYAYHLKLTEQLKLGFALSGGLLQYEIDGAKVTFHDPGDPVLDDQLRRDLVPDVKFGLYLYSDDFWFGASAPQLAQNQLQWLVQENGTFSTLEDHYYATAGYKYDINDNWRLTPSVLVKYVQPVPVKVDASLLVTFRQAFWIGGSWRSDDAIAAMLGFELNDSFQFGYSFDMTTSNLENYTTGTHEVTLGIRISKKHVVKEKDASEKKKKRKKEVSPPNSTAN